MPPRQGKKTAKGAGKKTAKGATKKTAKSAAKKTARSAPKKVAPNKPSTVKAKPVKPTTAEASSAASLEDTLRKILNDRREDLFREAQSEVAKYIKGENRQLVETALDDGDWSVIDVAEDITLRRLSSHRETIVKIDEALRKLDDNTYGICDECGEHINAERLRVLPFAILCRDCQEEKEEFEAATREDNLFQ